MKQEIGVTRVVEIIGNFPLRMRRLIPHSQLTLGGLLINLRIEFNGLSVTPENKIYIEDCFQAIYSLSPSESSVSFTFEKNNDGFSGVAVIVSQIKNFKVSCQSASLNGVMKALNLEVRKSLVVWKKNRFYVA